MKLIPSLFFFALTTTPAMAWETREQCEAAAHAQCVTVCDNEYTCMKRCVPAKIRALNCSAVPEAPLLVPAQDE